MCELLAISSNVPVGVSLSWAGFVQRGCSNPHGWGFAYYDATGVKSKRFPTPLDKDHRRQLPLQPHPVKTKVFLAHVRYQVCGKKKPVNTQPFICKAQKYAIAATMFKCKIRERYKKVFRTELLGNTGPEIFFHLLRSTVSTAHNPKESIKQLLEEVFSLSILPTNASSSFAFTDGETIYVFRHSKPLFYVNRRPPHNDSITLTDPQRKGYVFDLSMEKGPNEIATIIASTKLTGEQWNLIPERKLVCIREGEIISEDEIL